MYRKTYIEIDTKALKYNVATLKEQYPSYTQYIAVVKGNAYGHGIEAITHLLQAGMTHLAVSTLEEAIQIRKQNITAPIILLQPIHIEDIPVAIEHNITITVSNYEYFKKLIALNIQQPLNMHLKINSGMNRLGISTKEEVKEIVDTIKAQNNITLEGIYTHFATVGIHDPYWNKQLNTFKELTSLINLKEVKIVHIDRSLTMLHHEKADFCTGVRIGVSLYGYAESSRKPSGIRKFLNALQGKTTPTLPFKLQTAFSVYSEIIETQNVKAGDPVGYGAAFTAQTDSVIGVVPIGYADGFSKKNKGGYVYINNKKYQIIAVDMGMIIVLVDETVKTYDRVEIIGEHVPVSEVAIRNSTNAYEVLCSFKESIPRIQK